MATTKPTYCDVLYIYIYLKQWIQSVNMYICCFVCFFIFSTVSVYGFNHPNENLVDARWRREVAHQIQTHTVSWTLEETKNEKPLARVPFLTETPGYLTTDWLYWGKPPSFGGPDDRHLRVLDKVCLREGNKMPSHFLKKVANITDSRVLACHHHCYTSHVPSWKAAKKKL